ncbi:tripartite motif-containing protein 16 [Betta splendens]|uniref:Tripartite motif-containing protein 16 n=1 Tax=Betta splendens TaxID=158456 RepID=A0A6P7P1E8_BETSP|nr:tripartite motif-containing protein 16 [Betta splendens]
MSDQLQEAPAAILCDMCTGEDRKPARKTCMKCEISMCVQHLQAHLTTPVLLQTHPLTEPMAMCGSTKCPQHGKLLEYYCLDDMTCVCVSCAIEDQHRLHNMKTFATAHKELLEKLSTEQAALLLKTKDENISLDKWEEKEREKLHLSSVRLIEAVTNLRDISLNTVQSSVAARMASIKTSKNSMQAVQKVKDTFSFLQRFSQVHQDLEKAKAVDLRKGLEPGSDRDKLVEEIRQKGDDMMKQAGQFWGSLLTLVDPENHQEIFTTASDLIFDPQVLGPGMLLSKDGRKVFYCSSIGECSGTLLIHSAQSHPDYSRWLVSLSIDSDWTIGLCDKKNGRNLKDGPVYGLCCEGKQLMCLTTEYADGSGETFGSAQTKKQRIESSKTITHQSGNIEKPVARPEVVEVFWNSVAASLSFFNRTEEFQREETLTVKMRLNNSDLVPFVRLGKENVNDSSHRPQQQWRCSCGNTYREDMNIYGLRMYSQKNCSCGKIIGNRCNTELVCELL